VFLSIIFRLIAAPVIALSVLAIVRIDVIMEQRNLEVLTAALEQDDIVKEHGE